MAVLDEIAQRLKDSNIASSSGLNGWLVVKSMMPDSTALGDKIVALTETAGIGPEARPLLHRPSFQVRVRGASISDTSTAYEDARDKIEEIFQDLHGLGDESLSSVHYAGIWAEQSPFMLRYDENQRPELACNFRAVRTTT